MLIRRDRLAKFRQIWVAIADFQIAQNLVVAPVLFNDEDHMLDALMHGRHDRGIAVALGCGEVVVDGDLRGQRGQLCRSGLGKALKAGFDLLGVVFLRRRTVLVY